MSDRFPQYPMFNNPSLLQSQQQQQQHPQPQPQPQQQLQQQPDQHAPYPDQNRMWQQQMQQFRPRSGMDINQATQQGNPQASDIFRARFNPQNSQMGQQTQPQPQFGLGMSPQQMGTMNTLAANQQQPFSDPSNNQSQSSHMPAAAFPNMASMSSQNPGLNAASLQQRNPGIMGMQNAGPMGRQLELMLQQQQQQQQQQQPNGGFLNAAKLNQQPQQVQQGQQQHRDQQQQPQPQQQQQQLQAPGMNHPTPADIFASPAMASEALRRPSPSHPSNLSSQMQGAMQSAQQHPPGMHHPAQGINPRRAQPINPQDITERIKATRTALLTSEADLRNTMAQMQMTPTQELTMKFRSLQTDIKTKQEYMARLLAQQQMTMQNGGISNGMQRLNPNPVPGQPGWAPQTVPSQVSDNNGGMGRGSALPQNPQQSMPQPLHPQPPNGVHSSPSLMQTPSTGHLMTQANVPRSGPTPNPQGIQQPPQQLGSPFTGQMNAAAGPNMTNKPPFIMGGFNMNGNPAAAGMQPRSINGLPPGYPPPIDKAKFDAVLHNFLQKKGVALDANLLRLNDQQIDLGHLHSLVMSEGGFQKVSDNESWHIIGGRMGFVQFPGSDREPAKSGPGVAQHLAHVYREYLLDFEQTYVRGWVTNAQLRLNGMAGLGVSQGNMNHPGAGPAGAVGILPNGTGANANGQPISRIAPTLLQYAHMSSAELHQRGISENIIALVEQHRPQLQRTLLETKRFQQQVRMNVRNAPVMAGMPADANGIQPPTQGGLMNDPIQQNNTALLRQQFLQKQQQPQQHHHQQHHQQQQQQLIGANMMENRIQQGLPVPNPVLIRNPEATKMAMDTITRFKEDFKKGPQQARLLSQNIELPYEQRAEFNQLLGNAHRQCLDLNEKLPVLHLLLQNPAVTQRAIGFCSLISAQRQLVSSGQPRFILTLEMLRGMASELHKIMEVLSQQQQQLMQRTQFQRLQQQQAQQQHQQQQPSLVQNQQLHQPPAIPTHSAPLPHPQLPPSAVPMSNNMNGAGQSPPDMTTPQTRSTILHPSPAQQSALQQPQPPPTQQQQMPVPPQQTALSVPQQQSQAASPSLAIQPNRSAPINLQAPPRRKPQNASTPSNTAPSPAAVVSVSSPAATNAPTPTATAASPSAPKSPKGKAPAKAKQPSVKRKMSKSAPAPPTATSAANPPASAPVLEQLQPQTSTSTNGSMKRAREEDIPGTNGLAPSPSGSSVAVADQPSPPKRAKVEWEGPPSEELLQKKAAVDNIKTEEEAGSFFAQMSELLGKMTQGESQQEPDGLSDTLNMLLKGVTGSSDDLNALSFGPNGITPLSPSIPNNEFEKYFDFTLGGTQDGEDDDSKTPELTSSSSTTNPSPGSNSGNEPTTEGAASAVNEVKIEESFDITRLGLWKEIDGGESSFYQTNEFKWDSTMPSLDQPWAIFTT